MNYPRSMRLRRGLLPVAVALALVPTFAAAQESPADAPAQEDATTLDRIVVTGSNIPRTSTETASPVQVISRQEIERTGRTTIGDFLQTLTVDGAGSIPKSFGSGFASGSAGVSLRGLGAGATLVLLNGRRLAPYGLADDGQKVFTDLSVIPMEAVERVEVLKDGASSIYGSDAIAGVVNIILRKDFTGAIVKGSYGTSAEGDGNDRKGSLTIGTGDLADGGFNAFLNVEGGKTDGIMVRDRHDRKWIGTGDIRPWGYDIISYGGLAGAITNGGRSAGNSPVGNFQRADGTWASLDPGSCAALSNVADQASSGGGCLWDPSQLSAMTPTQSYINLFTRGTFAINDASELYFELGYTDKNSDWSTTPSGVSGVSGYPGGVINSSSGANATILGALHPDNPFGIDGRLRYSPFASVGTRRTHVDNQFMRALVGAKGTMGEWSYDVGYLHSETDLSSTRNGYLRYSVLQAVLTDPDNPYGGWLRLGANADQTPASVLAALSPTIGADAETSLDALNFNFSRSLAELRGGDLGLALGGEYRRQEARLDPVTYTDVGDIIGLGYSAYDGDQTVAAAYAELSAPVLESLELSGALRMDSYKGGDTATTPKVGIKWTPAQWLSVRGTYAEGFRAPNPAETAGSSVGYATATDLVRCPDGETPIAPGIPCQSTVAFASRPNPDLKPEESKSYSVGIVLQPTDSTSLTLDAWRIKRTNEITQEAPAVAIAQGDFVRGDDLVNGIPGTGTLLAVTGDYVNSNSTTVEGVDLDARQRFAVGAGQLTLDLQWSHIRKYVLIDTSGTEYDFAGTHGNCNVSNCIGTPKDRINLGATWEMSNWSVSAVANYRGSFDNVLPESGSSGCAATFANDDDAPGGCEIPSFYSIDLSGSWKPTEAIEVFGSVQNLTDRIAPLDPTTYGALNYNPLDVAGAIGRYYTVGIRYSFQ
ncbi:TonB-dependent receptor [Luteimonas mephitis]|uniref:TonB-dependent receptor n=1 Tax=Luteimonas mephitis TaxID=83615 RepID=UPI000424AAB4|nr:TonB-dependent receptor [Luteimonas mephitis]